MKSEETYQLLEKAANLYKKDKPSKEEAKTWYELFKSYDYETMKMALNNYALKGSFYPNPAGLIKAYWEIVHKQENEAMSKAMEGAKDCKYCQGTGWFRTIISSGESYVCACKCQGNPANLNLALASRDFKWSNQKRAFVPRDTWVGDEEPLADQEEYCFDDVGNLAKAL